MNKVRLDQALAARKLVATRSQAESYIKLGKVKVNGKAISKAGYLVSDHDDIKLNQAQQYVSRAGLKLASVAEILNIDFENKVVLDVGSSTGGFTDYAIKNGAKKVLAVDVGTDQLHPSLQSNPKIELHEKTDIRSLRLQNKEEGIKNKDTSQKIRSSLFVILSSSPDIVLVDVSFISLRQILPAVAKLSQGNTQIVAMLKPQFEAGQKDVNKGIIKNDTIRRQILKDFELWAKKYFIIQNKADSQVAGSKGNNERFYLLKLLQKH